MQTLKHYIQVLIVPVLLAISSHSLSQGSDISFQRITINEGLSLSSVYQIFQDSHGFMWFATEDGLNKYDGQNFVIYNHTPGRNNTLSHRWIEHILEDRNGQLWLGSRRGVSVLDPSTDRIYSFVHDPDDRNSISGDTTLCMYLSEDYLWVGTTTGLSRIDIETFDIERMEFMCGSMEQSVLTIYSDKEDRTWVGTNHGLYVSYEDKNRLECVLTKMPDNSEPVVRSVHVSADTLWVGTQDGLLKYILEGRNSIVFKYPVIQYLNNTSIETLFEDSRGGLWIITSNTLLKLENGDFRELVHTDLRSPSLAVNPKKPIREDSNGIIWFGTFGDGLYELSGNGKILNHFLYDAAVSSSLSDNTITCIYEDRGSGLWFGTFGAGINLFDPGSNLIKTLRHNAFNPESLSSSFVWSIQEDSHGKVWIGTNTTGINVYDPVNEHYTHIVHDPDNPASLPEGAIREIFMSSDGTIWVGTDGGGLSKFDPKNKTFQTFISDINDPNSISNNSVRTIYEDSTGTLWIGTRNGLNKFDPGTGIFTRYMNDPNDRRSISNNFVYSSIYMDKRGTLWVGTYGGGLNMMDPGTGKFSSFRFDPDDPYSISDDIVFSIYEDEKGYFWIGTNSGLNLFNPSTGKFKRYGIESGLPNEVIYGIVSDHNNRLWLSTNKGISRLDLTEFRFKNFDVKDGLQSNEFNGGAFHRGQSGLIYAGGVYGLSIIDPDKMIPVKNTAELIVSRLEILGKEVRVFREGITPDSTVEDGTLVEMVENFYLPQHIPYLKEVRLSYKQRFFSIEFTALNHHQPEKLSYLYRMVNLEEYWNNAGARNYVMYANMKPGTYIFEADAVNADGSHTASPARLKIIIQPPFWLSYWFMLIMAFILSLVVIFIYRYLLNQRTNKLLKDQYEQIRRANRQLRISEANLQELNATKDKFFSIISHDLKNPFASVMSISELLATNYETAESDEIKYGINKINDTNKHIYELLENLLTWSKSQRGNIEFSPVEFRLEKIIETNINLLKLAAEKKDIKISLTCPDSLVVYGDREMISTVFRNLLNNAVKFTLPGKQIRISTSKEDHSVFVHIEDDGIGISEEDQKRLFHIEDKFKRDGTSGEKGTGLGLIICKEFVEKNGGMIKVSSEVRKGSTFSFSIPVANGQAKDSIHP